MHLNYTCSSSQSVYMQVTLHHSISLFSYQFCSLHVAQKALALQDIVVRVTMQQRYDITPGLAPGLGSSTLGTRPSPAIRVSQEVLWCHPLN